MAHHDDGSQGPVANQRFRPHFHETFLIGVKIGGAELFEARGARHVAPSDHYLASELAAALRAAASRTKAQAL